MTYFTNESPLLTDERDTVCDHIQRGAECRNIRCELDSSGYVDRTRECAKCVSNRLLYEGEDLLWCADGRHEVQRKHGILWRSFDHYPPQGDEALFVCDECVTKPRHLRREALDRRDREREEADQSAWADYDARSV